MNIILLIVYALSLAFIFVFSLVQLHLTYHYLKSRKRAKPSYPDPEQWPHVTVQLPVFNEKYVIERLLKAVIELKPLILLNGLLKATLRTWFRSNEA